MRNIYFTFLLVLFYAGYSQQQQQQQGNLFIQSNINVPVQSIQSKNYSNTVNLINGEASDNTIEQQKANELDNFISNKLIQTQSSNPSKQANDAIISNGKLNDFSLNFSSRSVSFSSNKKIIDMHPVKK